MGALDSGTLGYELEGQGRLLRDIRSEPCGDIWGQWESRERPCQCQGPEAEGPSYALWNMKSPVSHWKDFGSNSV